MYSAIIIYNTAPRRLAVAVLCISKIDLHKLYIITHPINQTKQRSMLALDQLRAALTATEISIYISIIGSEILMLRTSPLNRSGNKSIQIAQKQPHSAGMLI
jgi:hypothetical protein